MTVLLGSQSPRRKELLVGLIGGDQMAVIPPRNSQEASFAGLQSESAIEDRLLQIVQAKMNDVCVQVDQLRAPRASMADRDIVLCADTIVVAGSPQQPVVLGKPPTEHWQPVVRDWFQTYYSDQQHSVWTIVLLQPDPASRTSVSAEHFIVKTQVRMPVLNDELIAWYLSTNEPVGKAGGYGIQGHAAALIESLQGSLTNVIGLPVLEVAERLQRYEVKLQHQS